MQHGIVEPDAETLLVATSKAARSAAQACRAWELGGDPDRVGESACLSLTIANRTLAVLCGEDDLPPLPVMPGTRRGRLALAAWLLLLAGTDEHGESTDLRLAAAVFRRGAEA